MMIIKWLFIRIRTTSRRINFIMMEHGGCVFASPRPIQVTACHNFSEAARRFPKNRTCLPECVCGFPLERSDGEAARGKEALWKVLEPVMCTQDLAFPRSSFLGSSTAERSTATNICEALSFSWCVARDIRTYTRFWSALLHYRFTHYLTSI